MRKDFELPNFLVQQIIDGKKRELRVPVYDSKGDVVTAKSGARVNVSTREYGSSIPFKVRDSVVVSKKITIFIEHMTMNLLHKITKEDAYAEGAYLVGNDKMPRYGFNDGKVSYMTPQDAVIAGLHSLYGIESGSPIVVYKFKLIMSPVPSPQP